MAYTQLIGSSIRSSVIIFAISLLTTTALCTTSAFAGTVCASQPKVREMTAAQIKDEIASIREERKTIGLFIKVGDAIQLQAPCNTFWNSYRSAVEDYNITKKSFSEKRANIKKQGLIEKTKYRQCFTDQLSKHPEIYNHELEAATTIEEFDSTLARLRKNFDDCKFASRLYDLSNEQRRLQSLSK